MHDDKMTNEISDTVRLLRECDAGAKMGISSIDDILNGVEDDKLKNLLCDSKEQHKKLECDICELLNQHDDNGKEPNPMAKSMSWIKTNMKMLAKPSDKTVAELMTDGCNMGVKSLHEYLNKYEKADKKSTDIANRLIEIETNLANDMASYL